MLRKTAAALACVGLLTGMTACAGGNGGNTAADGDTTATGDMKVAFVPKIQGIPFFEAMNTGGQQAAKDFGFTWIYSGPTTADPAAQSDVVRSLMQQRVNALMVAPNDPDSIAPLMKEAADKGIRVGTTDTDATSSVREVFVNQATAEGIGGALLDEVAKPIDGKGKIAIVSCGQTAANLNSWIDVIKKKQKSDYPDIDIVDVVYADEDQPKAVTMAKNLMNANPDLKGLIGPCTTAAPGIAQAVQETGNIGKVFTVGVGTPQAMLPYLKDGSSTASVLWDVNNQGYLTAWAGWMLAKGEQFQPTQDVGPIKGVTYNDADKTLLMGDPLILTADNAGNYNY
ncbi:autoinducer 2 ABC transporter substrate-binding protein [Corynebacterium choanae]|uniref:Autoinducer 2-binding protein LsrB n=2 Tax=Corynebacterium choanae TaxID=1862358 RepID=A0A3G6J552_9CORY|nr:autoinducer 2 ABC transporter substrate-binding protein [Corynebacterium choanae]AZA13221.1 Autoinducer 2-binding protein LsrB precursor [Corynebacterium choanae]